MFKGEIPLFFSVIKIEMSFFYYIYMTFEHIIPKMNKHGRKFLSCRFRYITGMTRERNKKCVVVTKVFHFYNYITYLLILLTYAYGGGIILS